MVAAKDAGKETLKPAPPVRPTAHPQQTTNQPEHSAASKPEPKPANAEKATAPAPSQTAPTQTSALATPQAASSTEAKPEATTKGKEPLLPKLSRKGDIAKALRAGATLLYTPESLYRIVHADNSQNRVSKRRAASFVSQGLVKLTKTDAAGKHYVFDPAAEAEAKQKSDPKPQGPISAA